MRKRRNSGTKKNVKKMTKTDSKRGEEEWKTN
jgi:hypothetical protein